MSVTIKDIAKEAGLGTSTVSAYLNGVTVRAKNRAAIEAAVKKLGYIRNDYARGLKTKKSKTIGVVIPEITSTFGTTIIGALGEKLSEKGYAVLVSDCITQKDEQKTVDFLISKMVDGLVVIMPDTSDGSFLDNAVSHDIPTVVIDRLVSRNDIIQIIINNREVSKLATQSILSHGCKNIGIITGNQSIYTAYERHKGYEEALAEAGLYHREFVYDGGLYVDGGYLAMKKMAAEHPEITGLFVTNNEMSVGAIIAINELGLKIGTDFVFVGFDNIGLSRVVTPPLATVEQPMTQMGTTAAEMLLKAMESGSTVAQTIMLSARLDEGKSHDFLQQN